MVLQINPQSIASRSAPSLSQLLAPLHTGQSSARALLERHLDCARSAPAQAAFVRLFDDAARAQADALDAQPHSGQALPPLAGLVVSVKDLFDVAGQPATGGSVVLDGHHSALSGRPAAQTADAPAVARLRAAGALLIGHGNCTEFAFSGVGQNPHFGTPTNPVAALLDAAPRIAGGSTSGGAQALALGACMAALGSDTGGSIRIPAALCGLVGYKSTQALVPRGGCIPLSDSLDTACAMTPDVDGAIRVHEALAARRVNRAATRLSSSRLAVPQDVMLDDLEAPVARAFEAALSQLSAAGARITPLRCPLLPQGAALQGAFSLAAVEAHAWHRHHLARDAARYDPRVLTRLQRGAGIAADDYLDLCRARRTWIDALQSALAGFDAALSPTVALLAPPSAPLLSDDDVFHRTNAALLRNPSLVNLFDGCAISLPCQAPGEMPVGLMLWAGAGRDDALLSLALDAEAALARHGG
ncbi:amidase [Ideonella sp. 4Y11]|uniref:Amidase n=1 Tax=Ideonella aquatica TaxID=2824119 RepID=A0A940YHJ2_9BURK|nr:amidase [Ideonella aquatica]MBQ0959544.1 amidase [Ideonella aquatica]